MARLVESGCEVRYVAFSIATRSLPPGFQPDTLAREVREATGEEGLVRLYVDQGDAAVPHLIRILDGAGLQPQTLTLARPSLDDVFLRQTGRSLREEAA